MKYSEFEREVEKLGCEVYDMSGDVVVKRNTHTILTVNKNKGFEFDNVWNNWSRIGEIKSPLFDLAYQLAKTPLAEREEEKKYYLLYDVPPLLRAVHAKPRYLYRRIYDGYIDTSFSQTNDSTFKTIFTESEIAKMDITGFQEVEVEG